MNTSAMNTSDKNTSDASVPAPRTRMHLLMGIFLLGLTGPLLSGCSDKAADTPATSPGAQEKPPTDKPTADKATLDKSGGEKSAGEKQAEAPANGRGGRRGMMGGPQPVTVVRPTVKTVPVTATAAATLASPNAVTLTPQVSGTLQSVHVVSGQRVTAGTLLFTLDAAPFRSSLNAAEAKLKGDLAQARYTAQQVKQLTPLVEKDYVTRQSYDQAVASAQAANAQVAQDQAAIQTAKINLSYTEIRAPISGRLGEISLQPGNLVQANSTALTTLVSIQKLLVNFSLPQRVLNDLRKEWPGLGQPDDAGGKSVPGPRIDILDEQAEHILGHGRLTFVDNAINPTSGTIRLQGLIDNPTGQLWPGQFVTARLTLRTIPNAEVVPATAVQLGDQGSFVYVVRHDKAETLPVQPLHTLATEVALPGGSIPADTQIIYPLPGRIAPGMAVRVQAGKPHSGAADHKAAQPMHHFGEAKDGPASTGADATERPGTDGTTPRKHRENDTAAGAGARP